MKEEKLWLGYEQRENKFKTTYLVNAYTYVCGGGTLVMLWMNVSAGV